MQPGATAGVESAGVGIRPGLDQLKREMKTIIFACVHNAGRSQMSAAFFNKLADSTKAKAISAGTHPASHVHPEVVQAMHEVGIDLSGAKPQRLTEELARGAGLLVTMGCGDECPYIPGLRRDDWPLPDPKGKGIEEVRAIRNEIQARTLRLIASEAVGKTAPEPSGKVKSSK